MPLSEKNLVLTVDAFKPENFDISDEILEFYETIKAWSKDEVASKFQLETLDNKKILKKSFKKKNLMEACTGTSFICSLLQKSRNSALKGKKTLP